MKKIVVLVSGGLDSSTVLAMLNQQSKKEDLEIYALSFNYSQNHIVELEKIKNFIKQYNVKEHRVIDLDLSAFSTSALVNKAINVPNYKNAKDVGNQVPVTYVPARNTIFLSYALGFAEVIGALDIYIGAHMTDSANYPDCREEYLDSFQQMANLATKSGINNHKLSIHAPLIKMTKAEIVAAGLKLNVDYSLTISCYDPNLQGESCGKCHACLVRLDAFVENGSNDPIKYRK